MTEANHMPKAARGNFARSTTKFSTDSPSRAEMRSCSGYGNCGYKSMYLNPAGGVVSICMNRRDQLRKQRDGVE